MELSPVRDVHGVSVVDLLALWSDESKLLNTNCPFWMSHVPSLLTLEREQAHFALLCIGSDIFALEAGSIRIRHGLEMNLNELHLVSQ